MTATPPAILALDLGTTEVKAGLLTAHGRLIAAGRHSYPIDMDAGGGRAEQDPEAWWAALAAAIGQVTAGIHGEIAAICAVGQGPTMVALDAAGAAVYPAITWMDGRAGDEAADLERATGLSGWGLGVLPDALWLERHEAASAARARWYFNAWEWAAFRLTGVARTTRSLGQVLPDPVQAGATGLATERVPPVADTGSVVGSLTAAAASALGLRAGIPIVAGMVDSFASFHGAGLTDPGDAVDTGGTSGGLAVYWDSAPSITDTWVARAPLPGRWIVGGAMTATGKALDWLADDILGGASVKTLLAEAGTVGPGADGLVFLPYLAGERSPIWDPGARGAFVGLTLAHGRAHLARAVLEAAALALRHVATPILAAGLRIDHLVVTGGTARGDGWNQIKADVLRVPVVVPAVRETAIVGAAILGATAVGWHPDTSAAIAAMVGTDHRLEPVAARAAVYDALFEAYVGLWPAIEPTVRRLRELPSSD